jgi:HSP20 family protein
VLAISGERTRPAIPGRVYQQMEIEYGAFERQVRLVEDIDPERAHARFEQGVLTIDLPVVEQATAIGRTAIAVERA